MSERIKNNIFLIYKCFIVIVLIGQFLSWIFNYNDMTTRILDNAMFSLIGIAYLVFAWAVGQKILKSILLICGSYLIVMNFLDHSNLQLIIAIVCLLTPMIFQKFSPEEAVMEERIVD